MDNFYTPILDKDLFPQRVIILQCPLNPSPFLKQISIIENTYPNSIKDYPKELMYQSKMNLFDTFSIFNSLKIFIENSIQRNYNSYYKIKESWVNIGYKYSHTKFHTHNPYSLSGVYYLKLPSNSGRLDFHSKNYDGGMKSFIPQENSIFIFDGSQPHSATSNLSKFPKICIAFNLEEIK